MQQQQQKTPSEDNSRAPRVGHRHGKKVAPASDNNDDDNNADDIGSRKQPQQQHRTSRPVPNSRGVHISDLVKVAKIKVINQSKPREEELTRCHTKCFFFLLGVGLMAFGIGLTVYGVHAELRDFLILGPSIMIIGFILITIGLVLICKDVYILNRAGRPFEPLDDDAEYYNIPPLGADEVIEANSKRMDLYTVASRPNTVTSQRSDGVLTTSDLLIEQGRETPDPYVPAEHTNEDTPVKSVPHPTSSAHGTPTKTVQNNNSNSAHGGSTITVKSSEDCDNNVDNVGSDAIQNRTHGSPVRTTHGSLEDSTEAVQKRTNRSSGSESTYTVQMSMGNSAQGTSVDPGTEASYCSPVRKPRPVEVEVPLDDNDAVSINL